MSSSKKFQTPLGASLVVLSSFFYASYGIWIKLMGNFFDGYTASVFRSGLVVLILVLIATFYHKFEKINLKQNWIYIGGMIIASLFTWGPQYFAILNAGVGISLAIAYASTVIGTFFFAWLFAAERFTKDKAISALLGIIGLALIFSPTIHGFAWLPLAAAFISGLSAGANTVFVKKIHYQSVQSTIFLWIASVVANALMVFILGKTYPAFAGQIEWFYLLIFAVASVIASWSLVRGVKLIDAGIAGVLGLMEIVFGVLFGVIFFLERPNLIVLAGMAIIIVASAIPYFKEFNKNRERRGGEV